MNIYENKAEKLNEISKKNKIEWITLNERSYNLDTGYNQLINRLIMKIHRINHLFTDLSEIYRKIDLF